MMLRLLVDRALPKPGHSRVAFELPPVKTLADAVEALDVITRAVAAGELAPAEGWELAKLVRATSLIAVEGNLVERVKKLEEAAVQIEKDK